VLEEVGRYRIINLNDNDNVILPLDSSIVIKLSKILIVKYIDAYLY